MNGPLRILPHLGIVLGGLLLVLVIVDYFNGSMGFLDNTAAKLTMVLLSLTSVVNSIAAIAQQRRSESVGR